MIRAFLVVAWLVAACGGANRPFERIALIPSYWDIVQVSGAAVTGEQLPILTIGRSSSARVELRCGEIDLTYTADTGGSTLTFGEQRVAAGCQAPPEPQDTAIRTAIGQVGEWRVLSDSTIELLDSGGRALLSLQATTCNCPHQPPGTGAPTSS